jgi:anaerobic selenocysteine-containing dehydrogenase
MAETTTKHEERWVKTCCSNCYAGNCPVNVHVVDGVVVRVEGNPDTPLFQGRICPKGNAAVMQLYDPYRVKRPLKRTNPKKGLGVDPKWVEITWDEALNILEEKLRKIREKNPMQFYAGTMDVHPMLHFMWFIAAFAYGQAPYNFFTGMGGACGEPIHMIGVKMHGSILDFPDLRHCRYLINVGGSLGESWMAPTIQPQLVADGREQRGLKIVVIDPRQTHAGAKADEWIPIRPATDMALFLAMMNVLVHELDVYDRKFMKRQTNAPYLIGEDGYPLKDTETNKPLVWDSEDNKAKTFDDPTIKDFALEGSYSVDNANFPEGKPAFQIFKDYIAQYTADWAAEITTIPATTIRRLTREIGEAASIGSTIVLDGKEYAFRPVAVAGYRGLNSHTNSVPTEQARVMLNMLLGASRSPGGVTGLEPSCPFCMEWRFPYDIKEDGITTGQVPGSVAAPPVTWKFPFEDIGFRALYPDGMVGCHNSFLGQIDPEKFGINPDFTCELLWHWRLNPLADIQDPKVVAQALEKIPYYVDTTTYLDEADEGFVDLVLPDSTWLERESVTNYTWYLEGINYQQPAVPPLYDSRPMTNVVWELAKRLGIITGPMGMNMLANYTCGFYAPPLLWDPDKEYTYEEFMEQQAQGLWGLSLDWFKEHGHNLKEVPPERFYYRWGWGKARLPFYFYDLKATGEELRRNMERDKVKEKTCLNPDYYCSQFDPLPIWIPAIIHKEDPKYDLYAFSFKTPISLHSTFPMTNPWLAEIAERDPYFLRIWMNREMAKKKGIQDDDLVWVESKAGKVQGRVRTSECIHYECLGFSGNTGWSKNHPVCKGRGIAISELLSFSAEYTAPVCPAAEMGARVMIYKA